MSYFGVSTRNGVGLGLGTVPSLTNTPLGYRLAPSLDLSFAGSDALSPAITFSRTTNATLTNSAGLVANAPMNLLTFSEQFDNAAWGKSNTTVTANSITAPDGTATADTLVENTATSTHIISQTAAFVSGAVYTYSVYAKQAQGTRFLGINAAGGAPGAVFNLQTGVVLGTQEGGQSDVSASIVSVGGDWYRCSVTFTNSLPIVSSNVRVCLSNASGGSQPSYEGDGTSGIYIWGAQLELGSTATTYNPTTVKNLLGFTEHFDNAAWTKSNASISATKVDDIYGQPFAQKLVEDTATGLHGVTSSVITLAGTSGTLSVYAKAGERNWVRLGHSTVSGSDTWFNLSTGTVGTVGAATTATSIDPMGNGWYRCSITVSIATSGTYNVRAATANGVFNYTGDGTSGIYIFGAQLADSASVDPYVYQPVAAPTSVAYYGPRFDYDPVTLAPKGLLIEEQRTNLLTYSEQLENAAWAVSGATVSANGAVAPDGTTTADKLVEDTATGVHTIAAPAFNSTISTAYTFSFYAKAAERNIAVVFDGAFSGNEMASFNLSTGVATILTVFGSNSASMTAVGNGWYRCVYTETANATLTGTRGFNRIRLSNGTTTSYTGNGTDGLFIWGAQLEAGAFPTSYIPTVASQVTRAADSASMIGNNFARWYNQTEGTFMVQGDTAKPTSLVASAQFMTVSDGTVNNNHRIRYITAGIDAVTVVGGAIQVDTNEVGYAANVSAKVAYAYQVNDYGFTVNGGTVQTITSATVPVVNSLQLGGFVANATPLNGHLQRFAYYNRRLSNTEEQGITS